MPKPHPLHGQTVPNHPCLQYWGATGYIRARIQVPAECRKHVGKHQLVKGLGTQCIAEAVRRSRMPLADFERRIAEAWLKLGKANARTLFHMPVRPNGDDAFSRAIVGCRTISDHGTLYIGDLANRVPDDMPLAGFTYMAGIELWATSKGDAPPAGETISVYRSHLRRLFEHLGHDDMGRVTEQDIVDYPAVLTSGSDGGKALGNKSVNNNMASVRAIFRIAKGHRKIDRDPTVDNVHKLKVRKSAVKDRKGFDRDQHAGIIAAALTLPHDDPRRWLWLLGAVYGARIGELADATVGAVRTVYGRLCFEIGEEYRARWNGQPLRLKTDGSPRVLPLHTALEGWGFIEYVGAIRASRGPDAPLFPMIPCNKFGKRAADASRQCNDWLRDHVKIDDSRLVFHSTRHTVKTLLRGRVEQEVSDAITGHDDGSVSYHYGETELGVLAAAIEAHIPVA